MKRWFFQLVIAFSFIFISTPARAEFVWRFVGGDPRSSAQLTPQAAAGWFISPKGQNDLMRQGRSAAERDQIRVYVTQQGVASVLIRSGNLVSFDGGRTWQQVEIRNLTFGQSGACVRDTIRLAWENCSQATGYYPAGLTTDWLPVVVDACGNMIEIDRPQRPTVEVPPPPPPAVTAPITIVTSPAMMAPMAPGCVSNFVYPGGATFSVVNWPSPQPINVNVSSTATGGSANVGPTTNFITNVNTNTNTNQNINQNPKPKPDLD